MQAPDYWNRSFSILAQALRPLGMIYAAATARRIRNGRPQSFSVPIICVGNINAGGTGKTPTVIALVQYLQNKGFTPHIVSRGFGGTIKAVTKVDPKLHNASQTGDEPLLMAAFADTWIADRRVCAVNAAIVSGADVILMDDGHQDPSVQKDLSLVVVDAKRGFGNGYCLPAGPLREPVPLGLARADAIISIGTDIDNQSFAAQHQFAIPHLRAQLSPLEMGMDWADGRYIAFAGIGHPEKFFDTLKSLGAEVIATHALDDHQPLSRSLMQRLMNDAKLNSAQLVTTEKDSVRLPPDFMGQVLALPVRLGFADTHQLDQVLSKVITAIADNRAHDPQK